MILSLQCFTRYSPKEQADYLFSNFYCFLWEYFHNNYCAKPQMIIRKKLIVNNGNTNFFYFPKILSRPNLVCSQWKFIHCRGLYESVMILMFHPQYCFHTGDPFMRVEQNNNICIVYIYIFFCAILYELVF